MTSHHGDVIAIDIGGANLKAADGRDLAISRPFELWRNPNGLIDALHAVIAECPAVAQLVVTMTGELADCFETKAEGVRAILRAVEAVCVNCEVSVYLCDGRFVDVPAAKEMPYLAAASNWHALAAYCCRFLHGDVGLLIDVGSTTCDVIPFTAAGPVASSYTDPQRLAAGELVYTGVERSPVCAVLQALPWQGRICPVAQEVFSTSVDAYLILGQMKEDATDCRTADGRPRTRIAAHDRLARSICADRTMFSLDDATHAAVAIQDSQVTRVSNAVRQVQTRQKEAPTTIVLSGAGEFLGQQVVERLSDVLQSSPKIVSLAAQLGPAATRCAPAHALAVLARERNRNE